MAVTTVTGKEEELTDGDRSLVVTPRSERPPRREGGVPKAKAEPKAKTRAAPKAKPKAKHQPRQSDYPPPAKRRAGSAETVSAAASDISSICTESVRELLRNRTSETAYRSRPDIGNVKLETFKGDRNHYTRIGSRSSRLRGDCFSFGMESWQF